MINHKPVITIKQDNSIKDFAIGNSDEYYVTSAPTASGQNDIKFNRRGNSKPIHYILILIAIGAGLYIMNKKIGDI